MLAATGDRQRRAPGRGREWIRRPWRWLRAGAAALALPALVAGAAPPTDAMRSSWPVGWRGNGDLACQWSHFFSAVDPLRWRPELGRAYGEDTHASYFFWSYPEPLPEGTRLIVSGEFPHARSMNFQVGPPWDPRYPSFRTGEGAPEISLLDVDIEPEPGHVNPFREGADRTAAKRRFRVEFELRAGHPVELNPRAAVPPYRSSGNRRVGGHKAGKDGSLGPYLWYRIYAPDRYDARGGVPLPTIQVQLPGRDPVLTGPVPAIWDNPLQDERFRVGGFRPETNSCSETGVTVKDGELAQRRHALVADMLAKDREPNYWLRRGLGRFQREDRTLQYFKMFGHPRLACVNTRSHTVARMVCPGLDLKLYNRGHDQPPPGNDEHTNGYHLHNTYLSTGAILDPGQALIVRARAPLTPRTLQAQPRAESSRQLRYWSLCLNYGRPALTVLDCVMDESVPRDEKGNYTIVLTRPDQRPANARADCGIAWLPWRVQGYAVLAWRFQSTEATVWQHAPQRIPWAQGDPSLDSYDPDIVEKVMGEYYPRTRAVPLAEVARLGCPRPR